MQNIVILAGNIGQTPEVRTTQGATRITNFSLATSRPRPPWPGRARVGGWGAWPPNFDSSRANFGGRPLPGSVFSMG